jgi:flagellin-like protein
MSKKGLSGIVTTLIIILLVFVAVGVIWGIIGDLLSESTGKIATSQICMDIEIIPERVYHYECDYLAYFERTTSGIDEIHLKVALVDEEGERGPLFDSAVSSSPSGDISPIGLMERRRILMPCDLSKNDVMDDNAVSLIYTPYFIDEKSGKEVLCDSRTYDFKVIQGFP